MARFILLLPVLASFALGSCTVENDTPTPTPEKTGTVVIRPPAPKIPAPKPTSKDARLFVSISPVVSSGVYVKKGQDAKTVALNFTASGGTVRVENVDLVGYASIASGPWSFVDFGSRVTSLGLFDEVGQQYGLIRAPDTSGIVQIRDMRLTIPMGTSKTLFARATLSSSASVKEPYDRIAVNIWKDGAFDAFDRNGERVTIERSSDFLWDIRSEMPPVFQTIRFGELTITEHAHPVSQIVIGGKDYWYPMAQYKATAKYESVYIDFANVALVWWLGVKANPADFKAIAIASGGVLRGQSAMSSIGLVDVDMSSDPIVVPKDGEVFFQLWAKFAPVVASSTVGGTESVSRSGHAPALGLNSGCTKKDVCAEWDEYGGRLNARSTGRTSGERIYVAGSVKHGNPMVLRKSQPIFTILPLASYTLANIDQDLFKFQVAADSAGPIAMKQLVFSMNIKNAQLCNFRVRQGSADMDPSQYKIFGIFSPKTGYVLPPGDKGVDISDGSGICPIADHTVSVTFLSEIVLSGAGSVFTLHATVSGTKKGSSVITSFLRSTELLMTTELVSVKPRVELKNGKLGWRYGIIWSDLSEVPHWEVSSDWTNDYLVQDLSGSVTLKL